MVWYTAGDDVANKRDTEDPFPRPLIRLEEVEMIGPVEVWLCLKSMSIEMNLAAFGYRHRWIDLELVLLLGKEQQPINQ